MYRKLVILVVGVILLSACGFQNRKGYYLDNHEFNYVRVENFKDAKGKNINHPFQFTEPQISTILKMVEIKKGVAFSKKEKERQVFDTEALSDLTPAIVKAFSEATPRERVGFSFKVKDPIVVIRNDRLTQGSMWVEDGKLHVLFDILYVKLTGDIDKRGYTAMHQLVSKSRGLEVTLELQAGQEYGESMRELVVDTKVAETITEERLKKEKEIAEKGVEADVKIETMKDKTVQERLRELKLLRKEKMISEEEFQQKRKELLNEL